MDEILRDALRRWINEKEDSVLKDIKENYDHLTDREKRTMAEGVTYLASMLDLTFHHHKIDEFDL